jgi:DNA polymerase-3 subunit epsilon
MGSGVPTRAWSGRLTQPVAVQGTFDELGTPLRDVTFVVVDLETTGGSPLSCAITEIGAVKVRGGEVLGEFQTLVNPGESIPPFIAVLTGITDTMVAPAPKIGAVLPAFAEFCRDTVLVAHNAPFDVGFLRAAYAAHGRTWPAYPVIDTARLARRALARDEASSCRLSALATLFNSTTVPNHRALQDARATVDVLHGLLERVGSLGVQSLDELTTFSSRVSPAQRRKRYLAERLPHAPGVYVFKDGHNRVLYVGKSKDIRTRVRTYFTGSESRRRMGEMVRLADVVTPIVCATPLEAEVRELRLIAEHKPRYNRRSRFPERATWLKLTIEAFPRLSMVQQVRDDGAAYLGPFGSRRSAEQAMTALHEGFRVRQCNQRLSVRRPTPACALAEMGRCNAPCDGSESVDAYAEHVMAVREAMTQDAGRLVSAITRRVDALVARERFEEAALHRDRVAAFLRAAARMQRITGLTSIEQLVAARRADAGGWEIHVVRSGRLVAAGTSPVGVHPGSTIAALVATAESLDVVRPGPLPAAEAEEVECVLRWLEQPGVRLVESTSPWTCPVRGAGAQRTWLTGAASARAAVDPFQDRRHLRPSA